MMLSSFTVFTENSCWNTDNLDCINLRGNGKLLIFLIVTDMRTI